MKKGVFECILTLTLVLSLGWNVVQALSNNELSTKLTTAQEENKRLNDENRTMYTQYYEALFSRALALVQAKNTQDELTSTQVANAELKGILFKRDDAISSLVKWVADNSLLNTRDKQAAQQNAREIVNKAIENSSDPLMLLALFQHESKFDPKQQSPKDMRGLGQISPTHIPALIKRGIIQSSTDLFRIEQNVKATEYVWNKHLESANHQPLRALSDYGGFSSPSEAKAYIGQVQRNYAALQLIVKSKLGI